jgi:PAS domain S-box-containing protein
MSMIPANDRLAARFMREWLVLAAALLMLGGGIGWSLYSDRHELEDEERERLSRRASMIDENIRRQLFATNRALESIRRDFPLLKAQKDSTGLINDRLQALVDVMPGVRTLLVYDADATVIATNRAELIGRNFREREYVNVALQSRNPAMLHLSAPYTTALGAFAMTAVKVIADDRGQVVGMVGVTITHEYFKTLLQSVIYAPDMRVSITHSDGRLFVMLPEQAGRQGQDLAQPGSFFTRHRDSGQQETVMTGIAYATGDERMMALRTVKPADVLMDKTLVVSVARDLPAIFALWRRDAYEKAMLFGLVALVAGIGVSLGQRRRLAHIRVVDASELERQRAENALRESRELLIHAFDKSPLMNTLSDLSTGKYLEVNDSFCRVSEFSREEAIGKTAIELGWISKDERMRMVEELQQAGWVNGIELALRSKNGQNIIARYWGTVIRSTQGDKLYSAAEDITERKQADYLFRESEKKYRVLLNNLSAAVVVHDADTSVLLANATAGSLLGLTEEQILGKTARDPYWCFLHDDGAPMPLKDYPVNQVITSGEEVHNLVVGVQRPDRAEPLWLLCNASPMHDETDNIVQVVVTFIDITERKQAETLSRESERRRESEHAAALEVQHLARQAALNLMEDSVAARTRAEAAAATLDNQIDELRRWQQLTLGREDRILTMKQEVNSLLAELGQPPRYASAVDAETEK